MPQCLGKNSRYRSRSSVATEAPWPGEPAIAGAAVGTGPDSEEDIRCIVPGSSAAVSAAVAAVVAAVLGTQ